MFSPESWKLSGPSAQISGETVTFTGLWKIWGKTIEVPESAVGRSKSRGKLAAMVQEAQRTRLQCHSSEDKGVPLWIEHIEVIRNGKDQANSMSIQKRLRFSLRTVHFLQRAGQERTSFNMIEIV